MTRSVVAVRAVTVLALGLVGLRSPAVAAPANDEDADDAELQRGVAAFQAGQFAAATVPLAAARAAHPGDLDTALLLGIAYYRLDDVARARPLLAAAARSDDAETRTSAAVFLGLLADADGDAALARSYYEAVARSSTGLADSARDLLARGDGDRWSAVAVIRPEVDSNVPVLTAAAAPVAGGNRDADLFVMAAARAQPFARLGLVVEETLAMRKQARLTDYDFLSSVSRAAWGHRGDQYAVGVAYQLDAALLGGAPYQLGHTGELSARHTVIGRVAAAAGYQISARTFAPAAYAGYSGTTHGAGARLIWTGSRGELELGYAFAREATADPALSATSHGATLAASATLGHSVELRLTGTAAARAYDPAALGRRDVLVRGDGSLYVALWSHVGGVVGGALTHNGSTARDERYVKWTAYLGVVVATAP
ncbi:MAG TPA: hypothetical protein VFP84_20990 [Kofleriaceae bacterium]|nr:hypothetical protein [Kofleriaceae bacterium]